ncbi:glycoside hydrolase family 43 protein [Sodalis sp. RH14]|uniref:glycoside hydrolase family 43 protein n=1 Tax=Sodalis sp. RH14 TaxID=3394329 RepID=UPI0039B6CCAB
MNIENPILKGFHPDPCICRRGDDFYIASSTFEWFPGIRLHHSTDLVNWHPAGYVLTTVGQLDMRGNPDSGGIWAPDISYHDGLFWVVYTNIKVVNAPWKIGYNYLVTAPDINGPWSEPVLLGAGGIDPSLFHADDGRKYLSYRLWGPKHHSNPHNTIVLQEYFPQEQKLASEWRVIFEGTDLKYTEAPHIYLKDGYYYLLTAEGGTRYEHAVTVARARQIDGPYELHPDWHILTAWDKPRHPLQKAGHGSLIQFDRDRWYMVYLTSRPLKLPDTPLITTKVRGYCPLGRETAIAEIEWRDGWPYVAGGPLPALSVPAPWPETQADPAPQAKHYDFNRAILDADLQTLRLPFCEEMGSLTARPGYLRLYGNDSLLSTFLQSTVARRWQHVHFTCETRFQFNPDNFQQSAGLACYYSSLNWSYCFVAGDGKQGRTLKLMQLDKGEAIYHIDEPGISVATGAQSIWLKVTVNGLTYRYSYSFDGDGWHDIGPALESWKLSDDYTLGKGCFTGAFVGVHCDDISRHGCHADFASLSYRPLPQ